MSQSLVIERFPLTGSHLIEASAGTGKTFTIALLYVRLVLGHGETQAFSRELLPNEILVVTFTDAASMELRARIRERLAQAARVFSGIETVADSDPLQAIVDHYPIAEHAICAQKLQRAAEWMDEAAVSTIHSWCYRMLREHAFNSGALFTNSLVEDHSDLWQDVVNDLWRRHFYQTELSAAVLQEIHQQWHSPAKLAPLLKQLAKPGQHQYRLNGEPLTLNNDLFNLSAALQLLDEEFSQHTEQLRQQFTADYQQITDCLVSQWENFNATSYKKTFAEKFESLFLQWRDRAELAFDLALFSPAGFKLKKGKPAPEHAFFDKVTSWLELRDKKASAQESLNQALVDLQLQLAVEAQADFEQQLLARAELGFDDLMRRLAQALDGPQGAQLHAIIRRQFPVAFIDEFQDTDPLQYQIFQRIYHINANRSDCCFVMIGDPKQAIYAFRGADIYTYLQARRDTEQRHYTLSTNFRSTEHLVAAVNGFFSRAEQGAPQAAFRFANGNDNPVPFEAVASGGRREVLYIDNDVAAAVNVWFDPEPQGIKNFRQLISEAAASDVVRCLNLAAEGRAYFLDGDKRRPLLPKDIAVLVRGRSEAQAIREALAARRVASVYLSDRDNVFKSLEAHEVFLWLQAVWQAGDDRSLRAALAVPSMGLTDAELAHYADNELAWEELVNQVRTYRELWIKRGVLPMLQRWLHDFKVAGFLLSQTNGERRLTNILHISEWLQQRSAQLDSELALIDLLQQTLADPPPEQVLRLESDDDLVKVVTIHKSKGLEYPLVLLPFIGSWRTADGRQYHEPCGDGYQSVVDLGDKKHFQAAVDSERLDEDVRLLYVALTRARHALFLGVAPLKARANNKAIELNQSGFGYVLAAGQSLQSSEEIAKALSVLSEQCQWRISALPEISDVIYHPPEKPALGEAAVAVKHYEPWWIASYSGLRYGGAGVVSAAINEWDSPELERARELRAVEGVHSLPQALVPGVHGLPKGVRTGNTLHEMMELYFAQALSSESDADVLLAQIAARRGFDVAQQQVFVQLVMALLERPLPLLRTSAVLAQTAQRAVELEFWFAVNHVDVAALDQLLVANTLDGAPRPALVKQHLNGMLKGFIDLVFEADGRYYVLDWKSNTLGESDLDYHREKIINAMAESRYDLQLSLYLLALHRHLKQRLANYDYEQHLGGALYWFVRGINTVQGGMYIERPPKAFIEALDALFLHETLEAMG